MEDKLPPRSPSSMEGKLQVGWRFFKVMMPGFQTKLALPPAVCEKLKGDMSLQATLITVKGTWNVGIGHGNRGKLYFEKGWDAFVQNHGLRVEEFAVFEYIGGICFNVSLLDKNGCEKVVSAKFEKDANLEEDEQNIASEPNSITAPLAHISQDEILLDDTVPLHADQEDINSSKVKKNEHVELAAVKLEKDEDIITSQLNSRLAPLFQLLAEIDNEDLPSHVNIYEKDKDRWPSQENILKHDNNKCHIEQKRNKERESCRRNSSFALSAELRHEKFFPSQLEHVNKVSVKLEVDEDEVPSQIKLQNPEKDRFSVKRKRDNEGVPSPVIQNQDMNRCSMKWKRDDDRAPSQAKIQKRVKNKSSLKHDKNKSCVKQKNHEDQVSSQLKGCVQDKKGDAKRKREPKVNISSPEQSLQFSTVMKPYHLRRRSPYMHIPAEFCVANGLYQNARITLKGPSDERQVSLKVCKGGKTKYAVITRGWPEFIAGNNLKEGDTCIFKLHSTGSNADAVVLDVEVLPTST